MSTLMRPDAARRAFPANDHPATRALIERIIKLLVGSMKHGFFKLEIKGEIVKDGKRLVVVEAGKSYRFFVPQDELE